MEQIKWRELMGLKKRQAKKVNRVEE